MSNDKRWSTLPSLLSLLLSWKLTKRNQGGGGFFVSVDRSPSISDFLHGPFTPRRSKKCCLHPQLELPRMLPTAGRNRFFRLFLLLPLKSARLVVHSSNPDSCSAARDHARARQSNPLNICFVTESGTIGAYQAGTLNFGRTQTGLQANSTHTHTRSTDAVNHLL